MEALGFTWDPAAVPTDIEVSSVERVLWRYRKAMPASVWDAAQLEGNPFTFPEVQTLMEGVTVGGRKLSDERQVIGLADSARLLDELVKAGQFGLDKATSDRLQYLIAKDEALEAGCFRGEGRERSNVAVNLGEYGAHIPPPTEPGGDNLRELFERGVLELSAAAPFERAIAYFLFAAYRQFYYDGNKRTGRAMMNGVLLSHGMDAISVPAARRLEFNTRMVDFYRSADASEMFAFMASCRMP
ncbi:Fic family protein [Nocardia sp. NPDC127579]|uniref:Fic family protein n=1 Tax=Nocardia sp. NPDC127579 TaxID=3345402 RepID=UPI00363FDC7D